MNNIIYLLCSKCKILKLPIEFGKRKNSKRGYKSWCKNCTSIYYTNNPDIKAKRKLYSLLPENQARAKEREKNRIDKKEHKEYTKNYHHSLNGKISSRQTIWKKQGIHNTDGSWFKWENYLELLEKAHYLCQICHMPNKNKRDWHVDHDHNTGIVRGLLCARCNIQLAWYEKYGLEASIYLSRKVI